MEKASDSLTAVLAEVYLPEQRATAYWGSLQIGGLAWTAITYQLDRDMRKTKKKQLMIMAKALFLHQPAGSHFTLKQIYKRLRALYHER